jgi:group I intron endonuclease
MKLNIKDRNKSGIYCIRNLVNNKVYIGKSINLYYRIKAHITGLNTKNLNENCYLINSWHKYGSNNFEYFIIEYLEKNEQLIAKRELYWIQSYDALNPNKGYNLRLDSSTGLIIKEETREKLRLSQIKRFANLEERIKLGLKSKEYWKNNPNIKKQMSLKVKKTKQEKYKFLQLTRDKILIRIWNSVEEIIKENPSYKWQNIYAASNGNKKSYMGYIWEKELKI